MAKTNFPKSAARFNAWFTQFNKTFTANYRAWGFTQKDCRQVNQWFKSWQQSYTAWTKFNKNQKFVSKWQSYQWQACKSMIQGYWSQIMKHSKWNGNVQFWFGSTAKNITVAKPAAKKATKKVTAKKTTAKKPTVKKIAAKKTAKKPITAKKPAIKKIAAKKPTVKKVAAKKTTTKKVIAKKATTSKPMIAKKIVAKKPIRTSPRATTTKIVAAKAKKAGTKKLTVKKSTKPATNGKFTHTNGASNAPFVWFTSGAKKGSVNVYVGSSKNGGFKPTNGANSAYVEYKSGSGTWKKLTQGSNFPFTHTVFGNNKKIYYRACWISNGKKGSWSPAMSYTFGLKAAA